MALDLEIQELLHDTPVQSINFQFNRIRVSPAGYDAVATCLSTATMRGRIRIRIDPAQVSGIALAEYDPWNNMIFLRGGDVLSTMQGKAGVVHECTHAQCDIRRLRLFERLEEAACYLAEAFFYLAQGLDPLQHDPRFPRVILGMALRMGGARGTNGIAAALPEEVAAAQRAMGREGYGTDAWQRDGIPGRRIQE